MLVFAPAADDPRLLRQRHEVETLIRQADDGDLALIVVVGDTAAPAVESAQVLRRRFHVAPDAFEALLIGKDGGVKIRSGDGIEGRRLSSTIDAMPMRRDEMSKRPG